MSLRIAIGGDHAGFNLKKTLAAHLAAAGHTVFDHGPAKPERCDYPDAAGVVARAVVNGEADFGVLVCGSGIGVAIAANKVAGARAANVHDDVTARLCRQHNDARIVCFGERLIGEVTAKSALDAFLAAEFEGGRHEGRVAKIHALEGG